MYELNNNEFLYLLYTKIKQSIEKIEKSKDQKEIYNLKNTILFALENLIINCKDKDLLKIYSKLQKDIVLNEFEDFKVFLKNNLEVKNPQD